ncbi:MAG: hypothetical protein AAF957_23435 [Planctomycetota bacterium]
MARPYKRRKKLILPGLQLRMSATFVGIVALMLGLQFILLTSLFQGAANELPNDGAQLLSIANEISVRLMFVSALVFLPLTLVVGVVSTFRVAGPLYRFQRFLEGIRDGKAPGDFRLRRGDELHGLAALLNDATRALRVQSESSDADDTSRPNGAAKVERVDEAA